MQLMCFFYQVLVIVTVNVCKIFGIGSLAVYAVENDVVLYWVFDVLHFKLSFTDVLTSSSNIIARSMTAARLVSLFKMALCSLFSLYGSLNSLETEKLQESCPILIKSLQKISKYRTKLGSL